MSNRRDAEVVLQGVKLLFPNFEGKEKRFNKPGDRNFCVLLEPEVAALMEKDGWNVVHRESRDPEDQDDEGYYFLKVKVSYNPRARPPQIFLVSGEGREQTRTPLGEEDVKLLDWAELTNVDLIVAPYDWTDGPQGQSGRTAYLRSLYATIYLDPLAIKYGAMDGILGPAGE